jgi:hypothetical protein
MGLVPLLATVKAETQLGIHVQISSLPLID